MCLHVFDSLSVPHGDVFDLFLCWQDRLDIYSAGFFKGELVIITQSVEFEGR